MAEPPDRTNRARRGSIRDNGDEPGRDLAPGPAPRTIPKKGSPPPRPSRGKRSATTILMWMIAGLLVGLAVLPTTMLFLVGMAPTIVALLVDRDREKYAAITVGSLNFCGVVPSALTLWFGTHTIDQALSLLGNPFNWLLMYFSAGLGWVLYHAVPPVVAMFLTMKSEREMQALKDRQQELIAEWGDGVTSGDRPDE